MGKNNKDDGLFDEPKCPPHKNTHQNEHEIVCSDCGQSLGPAPH